MYRFRSLVIKHAIRKAASNMGFNSPVIHAAWIKETEPCLTKKSSEWQCTCIFFTAYSLGWTHVAAVLAMWWPFLFAHAILITTLYQQLFATKCTRCRQGSNLCGHSPMDFKSIALTTRPRQPWGKASFRSFTLSRIVCPTSINFSVD